MSTKSGRQSAQAKSTAKARRDALAATQANLDKIDASERKHEITSPAIDPTAQQVASIDVDPAKEMAAAKAHAAKSRRVRVAKPARSTTEGKRSAATKPVKKSATPRSKRSGMSGLDAAAKVLAGSREPMRCADLTEAILKRGLWSTKGKTPAATLNAAMLREMKDKGRASRFRKAGRGLFALGATSAKK